MSCKLDLTALELQIGKCRLCKERMEEEEELSNKLRDCERRRLIDEYVRPSTVHDDWSMNPSETDGTVQNRRGYVRITRSLGLQVFIQRV